MDLWNDVYIKREGMYTSSVHAISICDIIDKSK